MIKLNTQIQPCESNGYMEGAITVYAENKLKTVEV